LLENCWAIFQAKKCAGFLRYHQPTRQM
jgi:hypothetical protein